MFCAFATALVYSKLLGRNDGVAWLAAGFMAIGYLTHLTLDEIYSVDVMDTRIKASFGTALKPVDFKHPGHSAAMAIATVLVFLMTPPTGMFLDGITSRVCGPACSTGCCRKTGGSASTGAARLGCPICRSAPKTRGCAGCDQPDLDRIDSQRLRLPSHGSRREAQGAIARHVSARGDACQRCLPFSTRCQKRWRPADARSPTAI